jgi:tyrosyl-tRNA synthetase
MLTFECYKQRMERGLTFLEFNYMIMQSYDFYMLFQKYGCNMQFGGDDQWANMLGGTELIRKKLGKDAHAMTITLLLNSEGKKMGKTEKGAVWLDAERTSAYDFFQYWRNVGDADVIKCLKMLTFVPIEQIEEMEKTMEGAELNKAKELLAYELTKLVHGEEEAEKALKAARNIFAGGADDENMPSTEIPASELGDGINILDLLVKTGLAPSKSEGRRLVQQNGIAVDDVKVTDPNAVIAIENSVVIKKGKKIFHKVIKA